MSRFGAPAMAGVFALSSICTACLDDSSGLSELKRLCRKDAGLVINHRVQADGYYDDTQSWNGAVAALVMGPYKFYEFCDSSPSGFAPLFSAGCYRLTKVLRSTGKCFSSVDKKLSTFLSDPFPEFRKTYCLAAEGIAEPMAKYGYYSVLKAWKANRGEGEYSRTEVLIKEVGADAVAAKYISYAYNNTPGFSGPDSCHLVNKKIPAFSAINFIEDVIRTRK